MSREIDKLAPPPNQKKVKVIVASCSRSGTLGLYDALKTLGYTPYHMMEVVTVGGIPHMKVFQEAVLAQYNRFLGIKRYDKLDYEKWMGGYDCIIEIPSYLGMQFLRTYADDPDVKFILTERDPGRWARSFLNTVGYVVDLASSFPVNILKRFEGHVGAFLYLNQIAFGAFADGASPGDAAYAEMALRRNYLEYIQSVKDTVPKDRLLVVKLEDGLGWEQICPFLGLEIPDEKYPRGNEPEDFRGLVSTFTRSGLQVAALRLGAVLVPAIGMVGYFAWTRLSA